MSMMAKLSAAHPASPNIYSSHSTAPSTPGARLDPVGDANLGMAWCCHNLLPSCHTLYSSVWLHLCPLVAFPNFLSLSHCAPHPCGSCSSCAPAVQGPP